jgi:hypothetical protein
MLRMDSFFRFGFLLLLPGMLVMLGSCETVPPPAQPHLTMSPGQRLSMMSDEAIMAGMRPTLTHRSRNPSVVSLDFETRPDGVRIPVLVAHRAGVARIDSFEVQRNQDLPSSSPTEMVSSVLESTSRFSTPHAMVQQTFFIHVR